MPTIKERILVTLTPEMARHIRQIARKDKSPKATVAAQLMRKAIDDAKELQLAQVMDRRLRTTKRWLTSEEFLNESMARRNRKS